MDLIKIKQIQQRIEKYYQSFPVIFMMAIYLLAVLTNLAITIYFQQISVEKKTKEVSGVEVQRGYELTEVENFIVEIAGAVNNPGVYHLDSRARLVDLVDKAQGFNADASEIWISKNLNLAAKLVDSQKVYIPYKWEEESQPDELMQNLTTLASIETPLTQAENNTQTQQSAQNSPAVFSETNTTGSEDKINANTASSEQLQSLVGIGPAYAKRIIDNRPYEDILELKEQSGVPSSTIEKIANLLTF